MKTLGRILIAFAQVALLTATLILAAMAWGPVDGGPTWGWIFPVVLGGQWAIAAIALVAAWKSVGQAPRPRVWLVGRCTSAIGVQLWLTAAAVSALPSAGRPTRRRCSQRRCCSSRR